MLDGARIAEDDIVLVVSPGEGEIEAVLDALGPDGAVIVVDASSERLEELQAEGSDPRVSYLIGDDEVLPLPDASVDVAVGQVAATEIERVLRR